MGVIGYVAGRVLVKFFGRIPLARATAAISTTTIYQSNELIMTFDQNSAILPNITEIEAVPTSNSDLAYFHYGNQTIEGSMTGFNMTTLPKGVRWGEWNLRVPGLELPAFGQWVQVVESASSQAREVFDVTESAIADGEISMKEMEVILDAIKRLA